MRSRELRNKDREFRHVGLSAHVCLPSPKRPLYARTINQNFELSAFF